MAGTVLTGKNFTCHKNRLETRTFILIPLCLNFLLNQAKLLLDDTAAYK